MMTADYSIGAGMRAEDIKGRVVEQLVGILLLGKRHLKQVY